LLAHLCEALIGVDVSLRLTLVNRSAERRFGAQRRHTRTRISSARSPQTVVPGSSAVAALSRASTPTAGGEHSRGHSFGAYLECLRTTPLEIDRSFKIGPTITTAPRSWQPF